MKYFLLFTSVLVLAACSYPAVKDHDSSFYSVPVGSTLTLNKKITIPADLARRFFQNGNPVNYRNINIFYPHCSLLMNSLLDYERTIKPAVFEIYKVVDDEENARRPVYYASSMSAGDGGASIVGYASYYHLRSTNFSDVRSLECVQWDYDYEVEYLSINEVKKALGDYFTLLIK